MSAVTAKRLFGPATVANAAATVYTTPANTKTTVKSLFITNFTAGAVTYSISVGADATGTRWINQWSIPANTTIPIYPGLVLTAGETMQAVASAATSLNHTANGVEEVL